MNATPQQGRWLFFIYPKKFGFINLSIAQENHSNNTVIATFLIISLAFVFWLESSHAHARIIHAIIIIIKHTTKIIHIIYLVNPLIIQGTTFTGFASPLVISIQSLTTGKHVFNLIQLHASQHSLAWTEFHHNHQRPNNTAKIHPNKYDNTLFFINFGIKYKIPIYSIIQKSKKCKKNQTFFPPFNNGGAEHSEADGFNPPVASLLPLLPKRDFFTSYQVFILKL